MTQKRMERISSILCIFGVMLMIWAACSFVEINAKNLRPNPTYNKYNLFVMMVEAAKK